MRDDFPVALDLLRDVLLEPAFTREPFERERDIQIAAIRAQKDHLLQVAFQAMRQGLFGPAGYGLDAAGAELSVQALTQDDLRAFHQRHIVPENCVLAVFGDVNADAVRQAVNDVFAQWSPASAPALPGITPTVAGGGKRFSEHRDKKQAVLVVGFPGASLSNPDRYPLEIIQEACSDLGSRLFMRIRDELGLAYYVGAQNMTGVTPGFFAFYAGTAPEQAERVEAELLAEAENLRKNGLEVDELRRAKAKIIGQRQIARQDLGYLAMSTALDELHGLGYAYSETEDELYEAVTLDQVKLIAQKYLRPDAMVIAWVRPPEK
jgi:zinc protease